MGCDSAKLENYRNKETSTSKFYTPFSVAGVFLFALSLTGCAGMYEPEIAEPPKNALACDRFVDVTDALATRIIEGSDDSNAEEFMATLKGMRGRFGGVALSGKGDVKERILTLVDNLPDSVHMLYLDATQYFDDAGAVVRACEAEGFDITAVGWS